MNAGQASDPAEYVVKSIAMRTSSRTGSSHLVGSLDAEQTETAREHAPDGRAEAESGRTDLTGRCQDGARLVEDAQSGGELEQVRTELVGLQIVGHTSDHLAEPAQQERERLLDGLVQHGDRVPRDALGLGLDEDCL